MDGDVVSGTLTIREEQKLKLIYTITNENYQIDRETGWIGNLINNLKSETEETVNIDISEALDGQTIQRSDYVSIKKK